MYLFKSNICSIMVNDVLCNNKNPYNMRRETEYIYIDKSFLLCPSATLSPSIIFNRSKPLTELGELEILC